MIKTKIIGLTGGIGSGKTTIAGYFESWGVPVYYADNEAKKVLYLPEVVAEVRKAFGEDVLTDKLPDKQKIAAIVFNDPARLKVLNGIIHPKVRQHFKEWAERHKNEPFVIKEAAILFESGSYKECDGIILVTAPKEIRIERVMQRDDTTKQKVLERMANQWEDDEKAAMSDHVIDNTNAENAKEKARRIYEIYNEAQIGPRC